ncbi:hypothetical protein FGE05_12990 [Pseudomonas sp. ICMP22404]|nr:hypothetical protein FGE05_12990 [Pseudomonas sp. ICMP22404]
MHDLRQKPDEQNTAFYEGFDIHQCAKGVMQTSRPPKNQCGSEPARESGGSVGMEVTGTPLSRAGSLPQ